MSFIWTCGMCGRKIFINVDVTEPLHMSRYACALCEECFKKEKEEKKQELDIYFEEYIDEVIYILLHINENVIIHRITGDPPKDNLLAPSWTTHKKRVLNLVENIFIKNNYKQGMYFNK